MARATGGSQEFVYGLNAIAEMLASNPGEVQEILLARDRRDPRLKSLLEAAERHAIKVHPRPHDVLTRLAGNEHHQGVVAAVAAFQYQDMDALPALLEGKQGLVVFLDGVQDPGNLGAILRSAWLMGADAVVIPRDRAAGVTPTVRKASAGALAHIPIIQVTNMARALEEAFETLGLWAVGMDQEAPKLLSEVDLNRPLALVMGGEEKGLRPLVKKGCHFVARIPQAARAGQVDSLNVSSAAAVALYEVARQRSIVPVTGTVQE